MLPKPKAEKLESREVSQNQKTITNCSLSNCVDSDIDATLAKPKYGHWLVRDALLANGGSRSKPSRGSFTQSRIRIKPSARKTAEGPPRCRGSPAASARAARKQAPNEGAVHLGSRDNTVTNLKALETTAPGHCRHPTLEPSRRQVFHDRRVLRSCREAPDRWTGPCRRTVRNRPARSCHWVAGPLARKSETRSAQGISMKPEKKCTDRTQGALSQPKKGGHLLQTVRWNTCGPWACGGDDECVH